MPLCLVEQPIVDFVPQRTRKPAIGVLFSLPCMKQLWERTPKITESLRCSCYRSVGWITFFDQSDIWTTWKNSRELGHMRDQQTWYTEEIARTKEHLHELNSDKALLEKFARERYLMKRDNEDIFVLVEAQK